MKLSDFVAEFLVNEGVRHVFAISGGASLHLIHSIADNPRIDYICPLHEQAGAMAADGYARITQNLGVAIATSGPGATNMITGICCAYYDSVPTLYITGQVATFRFKGDTGVRQYGFQETDIVDICRPITKYAVTVQDPQKIQYELEKSSYMARTGRPGPVLIDIPDNLQRAEIDPNTLVRFIPDADDKKSVNYQGIHDILPILYQASRPVIIFGWGIRLAGAEEQALQLIEKLGFPVVPTWGAVDLIPYAHHCMVGTFGTHGTRYGNFAVQNADLILAIGTRLDTHETGSPLSTFARDAKRIVVDIDGNEIRKASHFGMNIDYPFEMDAKIFITKLLQLININKLPALDEWHHTISNWRQNYPICPDSYRTEEPVNPYVFIKELSDIAAEGDTIFIDTGCSVAWMMQAFEIKYGQRLFHDFNNTAMGYAIPASIGASIAKDKKAVICITGDGSLHMNIQELATILHYELPIKIIVLNNHGYSMIQQTQDQWLGSKYVASSAEGGVPVPNISNIAEGYGYKTHKINTNNEIRATLKEVMREPGPVICDVQILSSHRVIPQVKYGRPIEDSEPLLDRAEFLSTMIVHSLVD